MPLTDPMSSTARPPMAQLGAQSSTASPSEARLVPAILALALGTNAGWAICSCDGRIASGTESFKPGRFDRWRHAVLALPSLAGRNHGRGRRRRCGLLRGGARHADVDAAFVYGGFRATLTAWCEAHQVPYGGVPVGKIKKTLTGKGNADEASMVAAARSCGHAPTDDNEAAAVALLHLALATQVAENCGAKA